MLILKMQSSCISRFQHIIGVILSGNNISHRFFYSHHNQKLTFKKKAVSYTFKQCINESFSGKKKYRYEL